MITTRWVWIVLLAMTLGAAFGCSSTTGTGRSSGPVTLGQTAKINYDRGMIELDRKSLDRARRYFKHVRREFPYSRFATLADLRLADCDFEEESYAEAAAAYRRFVRLHRTHENVDHAAFRRGFSFYKMIPTDWFLVPSSSERDMSATQDALRELRAFIRQYPQSDYLEEAQELLRDCFDRMAEHEMYVARFYLRRNKNKAAIGRTRYVEERYPESRLVAEAIFLRGETFLNMDDNDSARQTFIELVTDHAQSPQAARARDYLRFLGVSLEELESPHGASDGRVREEGDAQGSSPVGETLDRQARDDDDDDDDEDRLTQDEEDADED